MNRIVLLILLILINATICPAFEEVIDEPDANHPETYAIVVSGITKDAQEDMTRKGSVNIIEGFLTGSAGVSSKNIKVLTDIDSGRISDNTKSTAENLIEAIQEIAVKIKPQDKFIFYYIGQANVVAEKLRFNLPGPDITQNTLADWLKPVRASTVLMVLDCPGAGLATKALTAKEGRIIVCACQAEQHYSTQFSRYFIPAFNDPGADSNGDVRISVLEAFTWASKQVDDWYRQRKLLTTETPVLEDNGDGIPNERPWRYETTLADGKISSTTFLTPK